MTLFFFLLHTLCTLFDYSKCHMQKANAFLFFVFFNTARKATHHTGVTPDSSVVCTLVADC